MPRPNLLPALLVPLAAAACGSVEQEIGHTHTITTTVTVTDTAILPGNKVEIPTYSSVVWRNHASAPLQVTITATTCGGCETVLGFAPEKAGACSKSIAPGAVASLCFHYPGTFPYFVKIGDAEQHGEIVVGGER